MASGSPSQPDLDAELLGRHPRGELGHGALLDHPAADEDADPAADALDLEEQVAGQEDRHALLVGQPADERQELVGADRVDGRRRLVEDGDARLRTGARPRGRAAGACRASRSRPVGRLPRSGPTRPRSASIRSSVTARRQAVQAGRVAQVLASGHARVEADVVGQVADLALDLERMAGRVEAEDLGHARRRARSGRGASGWSSSCRRRSGRGARRPRRSGPPGPGRPRRSSRRSAWSAPRSGWRPTDGRPRRHATSWMSSMDRPPEAAYRRPKRWKTRKSPPARGRWRRCRRSPTGATSGRSSGCRSRPLAWSVFAATVRT